MGPPQSSAAGLSYFEHVPSEEEEVTRLSDDQMSGVEEYEADLSPMPAAPRFHTYQMAGVEKDLSPIQIDPAASTFQYWDYDPIDVDDIEMGHCVDAIEIDGNQKIQPAVRCNLVTLRYLPAND